MKRKRPIVTALAVCHRDISQAHLWLRWLAYLTTRPGGDMSGEDLYIVCTQRVGLEGQRTLGSKADWPATMFRLHWHIIEDEDERGYPGSASHLFLRTLQHVKRMKPRAATMFCESDTAPTRPTWFTEIAAEWQTHSKSFMGMYWDKATRGHMIGNGVYGANWRRAAPSIERCITEGDTPQYVTRTFTTGKGHPWDIYCADDILESFHSTELIHQIWIADPWTDIKLSSKVPPRAAFLHRSKDGSLIAALSRRDHPDFMASQPVLGYYSLESGQCQVTVGARRFDFTPCARVMGVRFSVYAARTLLDKEALDAVADVSGVRKIDQQEYELLLAQSVDRSVGSSGPKFFGPAAQKSIDQFIFRRQQA